MTLKLNSSVLGAAIAALVTAAPAPAFAQTASGSAASYGAGVDLGRTLHDPRQCTGSGDFRQGCVDGVTESRFDQEADQAFDSAFSDPKPVQPAPNPPGKPGDSAPPN
jgi:hypothetical protein